MKTEDLVAALARSAEPLERPEAGRRLARALAGGALVSLLAVLLLLGPRSDWRSAAGLPMFWVKLAFPAATAAAASIALGRLGHPGHRLGWSALAVALPALIVWIVAAAAWAIAAPGERVALLLGSSSWACPLTIAALSVPSLVFAVSGIRQLAPTRLGLTGAFAGLFAGAAAAFAYAMHCVEMQAPFIAAWYLAGMLIPATAGALLGRKLLHW